MKHQILILCMVSLSTILISCDPKDTPEQKPEKKTEYVYKLVSSEIVEFKKTGANKSVQDITIDKVKDYFGERVELATPLELQFKKDSLYIVKPNSLIEKYKMEWRNENLYLYNEPTNTWRYCGKRISNNKFSLNIGFYSIVSKTESRTLRIIGQNYAYESHSHVVNPVTSSKIWVKTKTLFQTQ